MKKVIEAIETNPYIKDVDKVIVLAELLRKQREDPYWFREAGRIRYDRPHSFVCGVLVWSTTEQGFNFWQDIYQKLYKQWATSRK